MQSGASTGKASYPFLLKVSVTITVLGVIGLVTVLQWTALAVRNHNRLASMFIFPAALSSERAVTAYVRMNSANRDAVLLQDKVRLEEAGHEAATVTASLESVAASMSFSPGRKQQIELLEHRLDAFLVRSKSDYQAIVENSTVLPLQEEMAGLAQENEGIQVALEGLQSDIASDFRSELSLVNQLQTIEQIFQTVILVGVFVALVLGVRSWTRTTVRKQEDEIARETNKVRETERYMLRSLIDNIPDFIYVKDLKGRFLVANKFLARAVGVETPELLLGKTDFDHFPEPIARGFFEDEQKVIRTQTPLYGHQEKVTDSSGKVINFLTTKTPLRDAEGKVVGIVGIGHDITEHIKMLDALREAETKYHGIFDKAIVGVFQSTSEGRFTDVNPSMAFTLGYHSAAELMASNVDFMHGFFVDVKRGMEFMLIMDRMGGVKNFECEVFQKDGNKIWLTMNIRAIREEGRVVRYEGMCEDITERIMLRSQLLQAQKLESVGQLAAGVAHEINTPAQYVGDNVTFLKVAFAELLELLKSYEELLAKVKDSGLHEELETQAEAAIARTDANYLKEEIPKALAQSLDGIQRVSEIVSAMKEFSHPGTKEKVLLDLNHAIESTITVSRNEWKYAAELETDFDTSLPPVRCYPGEFNQVILNLIVNAAHAISDANRALGREKGKITVRTKNQAEYVEIRIEDTGTGIPEKVRSRIFDPFFTTKEVGKGTGQGLAIARSVVVDKHGGTLDFETVEGAGTAFIVRLPHNDRSLKSKAVHA
jgi:PAS domain S-box-containing protein